MRRWSYHATRNRLRLSLIGSSRLHVPVEEREMIFRLDILLGDADAMHQHAGGPAKIAHAFEARFLSHPLARPGVEARRLDQGVKVAPLDRRISHQHLCGVSLQCGIHCARITEAWSRGNPFPGAFILMEHEIGLIRTRDPADDHAKGPFSLDQPSPSASEPMPAR